MFLSFNGLPCVIHVSSLFPSVVIWLCAYRKFDSNELANLNSTSIHESNHHEYSFIDTQSTSKALLYMNYFPVLHFISDIGFVHAFCFIIFHNSKIKKFTRCAFSTEVEGCL